MTKQKKKNGAHILLGVCGGIAAYKSCEVARLFIKAGATVQVMMSASAQKFVTAMTFQALTGRPVATDLFDLTQENEIGHIKMADEADVVVVAPATANILAKATHGLCNDLISTVLLATKAPVLMAPSMNVNMYENAITQENLSRLKKHGFHIIDPEEGFLACGWDGKGRLAEPANIVKKALSLT
jgi:phosphopantothenoylcysteine decarboxylase/phosphopantothenate--cysteine ligase